MPIRQKGSNCIPRGFLPFSVEQESACEGGKKGYLPFTLQGWNVKSLEKSRPMGFSAYDDQDTRQEALLLHHSLTDL